MLPPQGGDTLWSKCNIAAYEALSPAMQAFLKPLTATHNITQSFPTERFAMTAETQERLETAKRNNPPVSHPVVRTHPVSGRRGLFVNDGFTTHVNELSPAESRALLPMLYSHSSKPEFVVRWKWREGDVAFWDNRLTQHYATDDYRPSRRVMNRATIIGDRPNMATTTLFPRLHPIVSRKIPPLNALKAFEASACIGGVLCWRLRSSTSRRAPSRSTSKSWKTSMGGSCSSAATISCY